jgi:putative ABC transport system permease protein
VPYYTVLGIGLGALSAGGGGRAAQNQAFADVNMAFGVLVNGLAAG